MKIDGEARLGERQLHRTHTTFSQILEIAVNVDADTYQASGGGVDGALAPVWGARRGKLSNAALVTSFC